MQPNKLLHFSFSANIVFGVGILTNVWFGIFVSACVGIGWELFWHFFDDRPISREDLIANGIGIAYALTIMIIGSIG